MNKFIIAITSLIIIGGSLYAYNIYKRIFENNINLEANKTVSLYVYSTDSYKDVYSAIQDLKVLKNTATFNWLANFKKLKPRSGRYILKSGMSNNQIVNMLRSGLQTPIKLTFNNVRTIEELCGIVGKQIVADSTDIAFLLNDSDFLKTLGFTRETIPAMFLPDTYEFYWTTDAKRFISKMKTKYDKFWNESRRQLANKINLTPTQVSTLASIVQAEQQNHDDEKPIIAGLYINRLKRNIPLESDPTLIFANKDFKINRVLNSHKAIDSPYNTYKYRGLPPGPILFPEKSSLKAVLNYTKNDYIFMCAKDDFSGYHNFSKTNRQHNIYSRKYHNALNRRGIFK